MNNWILELFWCIGVWSGVKGTVWGVSTTDLYVDSWIFVYSGFSVVEEFFLVSSMCSFSSFLVFLVDFLCVELRSILSNSWVARRKLFLTFLVQLMIQLSMSVSVIEFAFNFELLSPKFYNWFFRQTYTNTQSHWAKLQHWWLQ